MTRTRQEIFDLAWNGLKAQGFEQSSGEGGVCLFRGPGGRKCAIGHCIPDDQYIPQFDENGDYWDAAFEAAGVSEDDRSFAESIQSRHDHAEGPRHMEKWLREFAEQHALTIPTNQGG